MVGELISDNINIDLKDKKITLAAIFESHIKVTKIKKNDHQLWSLLIVKLILLVSTSGTV